MAYIQTILSFAAAACLLSAIPANAADVPDFKADRPPADAIWLETLDLTKMTQGYGSPHAARSVDGNPIKIAGETFPHGVGTHANGDVTINLKGAAVRFLSMVGVDDEKGGAGTVSFEVLVDGKKAARTGTMRGGEKAKLIDVDLTGAKELVLAVNDGGDDNNCDHADWAGAMIVLAPGAAEKPETTVGLIDPGPTLEIASGTKPEPAIHGPKVVGTTPGNPFIFLVPATGEGPLTYSAANLPKGLSLDSSTGIITGSLKQPGEYIVKLTVKGPKGVAKRDLKIVGGDHKLALTPPMGWNSWNVWAGSVDDAKVRAAADAMVKSGLAAHGYQYINIDDCWEGSRDANGEITTNQKFPDMKALADYVHSKGLKLGIYSSPGPKTCAGFEASYQHEEQDAKTWAKWGIDYVKYDWCSYGGIAKGNSLKELQKPYRIMRQALDKCGRDIVYSLCQYGMGDVWKWGGEIGGNCWRTTGDINDSWGSMSGIGFSQNGHEIGSGPGHWNDPDMMVVGKVGWGPNIHPTRLTPNEQITHVTLWTLLASPILLGCDLSQLDQFTLDLLTNDEVIDVHQDPLGKQATRRSKDDDLEVWSRPLEDGTIAVGLFNRGRRKAQVTANWSDMGITGAQPIRDLWQQKDLGTFNTSFTTEVPAHGAVLVKIGKGK